MPGPLAPSKIECSARFPIGSSRRLSLGGDWVHAIPTRSVRGAAAKRAASPGGDEGGGSGHRLPGRIRLGCYHQVRRCAGGDAAAWVRGSVGVQGGGGRGGERHHGAVYPRRRLCEAVPTVTVIGIPSLGALGTASVAEWFGARNSVGIAAAVLAVLSLALLVGGRSVREAG